MESLYYLKGMDDMYYVPSPHPYPYPNYQYVPVTPYMQSYMPRNVVPPPFRSIEKERTRVQDQGPQPFVIDIEDAAEENTMFLTTLWTGEHLQVTLMSIPIGGEIGLEVHEGVDQFLRIEEGDGVVEMGMDQNALSFRRRVSEDSGIMVPAGTWHNVTNTGDEPLKLFSVYAPPEHPIHTQIPTKANSRVVDPIDTHRESEM